MIIKKITLLIFICVISLNIVGCRKAIILNTDLSINEQAVIDIQNELTPETESIPIYQEIFSFKKAITLVFEGYTNDIEMMELADVIEETGVNATFFIPGAKAMENPDVIKYIADAGIEIGNYTLTGEKNMEKNNTEKIIRQIYLTQEAIDDVLLFSPRYFMCNQTEYTEEILKIANLCRLNGAVKPSVFLNHRSFQFEEQILNYTKNINSGAIVSFKLGQELDESEIDDNPAEDEKPAKDKQPSIEISEELPETPLDTDIVRMVEVFLEEVETQGFEILSLKEFHDLEEYKVEEFEVTEELLEKLDPNKYPENVTPEPFGLQETKEMVDGSYFDKTVFVGDSIMQGISNYVEKKRKSNPNLLGNAQFLVSGGLSVRNALWEVNSESRHPVYGGKPMKIEDAIGDMDVDKVYIMLGMNDVLLSSVDDYLNNYQSLIMLIREQSPNVEFYLCSITPGSEGDIKPTNEQILSYTLKLVEFCAKYGYNYVDVAHAIRDEKGCLPVEMCSDPDGMRMHFKEEACEVWIDYIYKHTN